jgi:hypothetical protein
MTRKDYELIAKALNTQMEMSVLCEEEAGIYAVTNIACDLADTLVRENPRFDRARFLSACGVK